MAPYLVRVTTNLDSGIPEDAFQNDWVIATPGVSDVPDFDAVTSTFSDFYNSIGDDMVSHLIASDTDAHTMSFYALSGHLDGSDTGAPVEITTWTRGAATGSTPDLPTECQVVLTLYGAGRGTAPVEVAGTRPKQRRTGRLYLGPWQANAVSGSSGNIYVDGALTNNIASEAGFLLENLAALATPAPLYVWSRADAAVHVVVGGHVDNAWDTQRRRGPSALGRINWGSPS